MVHSNGEVPPQIDKHSLIFIVIFSVLIFVIYSLISNIMIGPVKLLTTQIQNIDENQSDKLIGESFQIEELDSVSRHFNELMLTISRQNILLSRQALTDALTQIANRRCFEIELEKLSQLFIRKGLSFTVIIADIDHFKKYNDELGHLAGDEALIRVAKILNGHFKRTNDLCARYGGEEFIMLYSDISLQGLETKLNEIVKSMSDAAIPHPCSPTSNNITISIGACMVESTESPEQNLQPKSLVLAADNALYQAKKLGRNRWEAITYKKFIQDIGNQ